MFLLANGRRGITLAKKIIFGVNDLQTVSPEIANEWHPTKNGDVKPSEVGHASSIKRWWLGKCGHEWETSVAARTNCGAGCPICSGRIPLKGVNDFATLNPEIAKQWHPTKNGNLTASDITLHSGRKIWWKDEYGHEWVATPASRTSGTGCPICKGRKKTSFPEAAILYYVKQSFPDATSRYKPDIEDFGNMEIDIWIPSIVTGIEYDGEAWHQDSTRDRKKDEACFFNGIALIRVREPGCVKYQTPIMTQVIREDSHTMASLTKAIKEVLDRLRIEDVDVDVERDEDAILSSLGMAEYKHAIAYEYPKVAEQWNYEKNGTLTPWMFTKGSTKKVWWICHECGNEWKTSISVRCIDGCGCPECGKKTITEKRSTPKPGKSLADARPDLIHTWHPTRNGSLTPLDISPHSKKLVWWMCPECGREWEQAVVYRQESQSCLCGKCSRSHNRTAPKEGKSLADTYPDIAAEWDDDKNGSTTPSDVTPNSSLVVWWKCSKCGEEWQSKIASRTRHGNACCKKCNRSMPKKPVEGVNDLLSQRPDVALDWDYERNNGVEPQDVTYMSSKTAWWKCHTCGTRWEMKIQQRSLGTMCPSCGKEKVRQRLIKPSHGKSLSDLRPDLVSLWDSDMNGNTTPSDVAANSNRSFWWKCENGHSWSGSPNLMKVGTKCFCPYCGDRKLLVGFNDLATRFPDVAVDWDAEKNPEASPTQVRYNVSSKRWWKCHECGREWEAPVSVRTTYGKGCRSCSQRARHQRDRDAKAARIESRDDVVQ